MSREKVKVWFVLMFPRSREDTSCSEMILVVGSLSCGVMFLSALVSSAGMGVWSIIE
jgi:hypothetical protein